jgi:hypothetical protein
MVLYYSKSRKSRKSRKNKKLRKKTRHRTTYKNQSGGVLKNKNFCKGPDGSIVLDPNAYSNTSSKLYSPAFEIFKSKEKPFNIETNLEKFKTFRREDLKWFKFVVFEFRGTNYIYVLNGESKYNKHPMCIIYGVLELSDPSEFTELRNALQEVESYKGDKTITEKSNSIINLNQVLADTFGCMEAISAGSGTILEDSTICINTKSGHFKPSLQDIGPEIETLFYEKTGMVTKGRLAANEANIHAFVGNRANPSFEYSGMCV